MKNLSKAISQQSKSWKLLPQKVKKIDRNHLHTKNKFSETNKNYLEFKNNLKDKNRNHLITKIKNKITSNFPSKTTPSKKRFMNL